MIPATLNQWPPSHTLADPSARSMPSALAASAPRTTAGYRAVAALRNRPRMGWPCNVPSRLVSAEYTVIALVSAAETRSLR